MGNKTFYWDGQNNTFPARYSPHEIRGRTLAAEITESQRDSRQDFGRRDLVISARFAAGFWPPRFLDLGEIRGRILAAEITESR